MNLVLRKEVKYMVNEVSSHKLERTLQEIIKSDPHNGINGYMIRSLYFDTIDDKDYHDKEDGAYNRRKIRLRIYDVNDDFAFLEMKQKTGDNQEKRSLKISKEDALKLCKSNYSCLLNYDSLFATECYTTMVSECYRPASIVEYDRRAYYANENNIRITFDQNIRATESNFNIFDKNLKLYPVLDLDKIVLEVKYNGFLLSYIKDVIKSIDKSSLSVSKYCLSRSIKYRYIV